MLATKREIDTKVDEFQLLKYKILQKKIADVLDTIFLLQILHTLITYQRDSLACRAKTIWDQTPDLPV